MKIVLIAFGSLVVLSALVFGAVTCASVSVVEEMKDVTKTKQPEGRISAAQFKTTPLGSTRAEVVGRLGKPVGWMSDPSGPRACIAYDRRPFLGQRPGEPVNDSNAVYTFCFWNGVLDHKRQEWVLSIRQRDSRPYPIKD